jgi:hypothetical protein
MYAPELAATAPALSVDWVAAIGPSCCSSSVDWLPGSSGVVEDVAPGSDNAALRKLARSAIEFAQHVKHSTTPTRREAGIADAVIQLANLLRRHAAARGREAAAPRGGGDSSAGSTARPTKPPLWLAPVANTKQRLERFPRACADPTQLTG